MKQLCKILIVDDNQTNLENLSDILEDYQPKCASSGDEALTTASQFLPDLIFLDVMMPGMDGYETCQKIRKNPELSHTRVIMISANGTMSGCSRGYEAGADDYIRKPFDVEELLAKIQVYMRLKTVEEVNRFKSDFFDHVSHETYTPLNGIIAPLQTLMENGSLEANERNMWTKIAHESARKLQVTLKKIMFLSELRSHNCSFNVETANLCGLIRDAASQVNAQGKKKNIQIILNLPDSINFLMDQTHMTRAVKTLLNNAIRFSPPNEYLVVNTESVKNYICIEIISQANHINPVLINHIFDGFISDDIDHHTRGTGLSLAIARQIIVEHQGRVHISNNNGPGITYTIYLPLTEIVETKQKSNVNYSFELAS